jgi:chromosome segregation ATPase
MLSNLRLIVAVVAVMVTMGLGYALGARRVASLERQIESITQAGNDSKKLLQHAQASIDRTLKEKEQGYRQQVDQLKIESEQRVQEVSRALTRSKERVRALESDLKKVDSKHAALQAERAQLDEQLSRVKSDPAAQTELKRLQDKAAELDRREGELIEGQKKLQASMAANECLDRRVPDDVVAPLIKAATTQR